MSIKNKICIVMNHSIDIQYIKAVRDLKQVINLVGDKRVISIKPLSTQCFQLDPCAGHGEIIIEFEDGTCEQYMCPSVSIGAIMSYYQKKHNIETDTHFTQHIKPYFNGILSEISDTCNVICYSPPNQMHGHCINAIADLDKVIDIVADKNVKSVTAMRDTCQSGYPCRDHGGVNITFCDETIEQYECSSVSIATIMTNCRIKYNATTDYHFDQYIENELEECLSEMSK